MSQPILLTGNVLVGTTTANRDVSAQVPSLEVKVTRAAVVIPSTFATDPVTIAGEQTGELTVTYYTTSTAGASVSLQELVENAVLTGTPLTFSATKYSGAVSATNPRYTMSVQPLEFMVGGTAKTIGTHSVTFPINGGITKATT